MITTENNEEMKILDITIDFETASLRPDAAPLQLSAVAWNRYTAIGENPFYDADKLPIGLYNACINANHCIAEGYHFDNETIFWWSQKPADAKIGILYGKFVSPRDAVMGLIELIKMLKDKLGVDVVCLWSQGTDCDITWLRGMCERYQIDMPVGHVFFRDARTFALEGIALERESTIEDFGHAYDKLDFNFDEWASINIPNLIKGIEAHNAVYDCLRSSYNVWYIMQHIRQSLNGDEHIYFTKSEA